MRKNINKLATLVMTGALAASMSFSAFAVEDPSQPSSEGTTAAATTEERKVVTDGSVVTLFKDVTTDGKTMAPNTTFELNVSAGEKTGNINVTGKNGTETYYDVEAGITTGITKKNAVFAPSGTTPADTYTAKFEIDLSGVTFPHAGIYNYTVQEVEGSYEGITYDDTEYDMYVFVVNNNGALEIANIVVADGATKISTITNKYGTDSTDDTIHDVTISKVITGTAANLEKNDFNFDITVTGATGEQYKAYITGANSNVTEMIFKTGESQTVEGVKNGTEIQICGLSEGDTVKVSEVEAGKDGYTTTYTSTKTNLTAGGTLDKSNEATTDDAVSFTVSEDEATLVITNTKDFTTPTGVAMDIAPYALMVALAGGAAATFLRKKESFED